MHETNKIKAFVQNIKSNTEKKLKWIPMNMTNSTPNFPRMSLNELQELPLGVYQLKQARAYIAEHMASDGVHSVKIANPRSDLLRLQSNQDTKLMSNMMPTFNMIQRILQADITLVQMEVERYIPKELQPRSSLYYTSITNAQDYSEIFDVDSDFSDEDSNTLYTLV
ncbi:unnamed protein product [Rotaria sp. Silwood2]|nr:unnamed protein product [Rotaria sp. Silwood2]CAF3070749.1 unnamed protein product [Rotaria sp. Silwood2]CAF3479363.1 unnamed protein product [Rotaria sp. Silwood2]CAF4304029.1 unnamed protein product [Rotaria sp. Silwood2]CAF4557510.1 unnamed protein product [Rotaria sp. Silwood2]